MVYAFEAYFREAISIVKVSVSARALRKLPSHVALRLLAWVAAVEEHGLEMVRKTPGLHDEPLKGDRKGQRSIRLNRAYRAIYKIEDDRVKFVDVIEAHKHKY